MAQPPPPSNPVGSAPPPFPEGDKEAQAKHYAQYGEVAYGQQYPPQAVPVAQGQPGYYAPQQAYYPAQPGPGGAYPPQYPPQQPGAFHVVQVPPQYPRRNESCFATPDWLFFFIGLVFGGFWIVGALLPLCRTPKFPNGLVKAGWIANVVGSILLIAAVIVVITNRSTSNYGYN